MCWRDLSFNVLVSTVEMLQCNARMCMCVLYKCVKVRKFGTNVRYNPLWYTWATDNKILDFFTFLYINKRKHRFRANFRLPVFDEFTRFGMSWTRFDYFWKMSICLCKGDKNFVVSVARKLLHRISWNFIVRAILP